MFWTSTKVCPDKGRLYRHRFSVMLLTCSDFYAFFYYRLGKIQNSPDCLKILFTFITLTIFHTSEDIREICFSLNNFCYILVLVFSSFENFRVLFCIYFTHFQKIYDFMKGLFFYKSNFLSKITKFLSKLRCAFFFLKKTDCRNSIWINNSMAYEKSGVLLWETISCSIELPSFISVVYIIWKFGRDESQVDTPHVKIPQERLTPWDMLRTLANVSEGTFFRK